MYFGLEGLAIMAIVARAVLVKEERAAWAWLAVGVTAYSLGDLAWQFNDYGAGPSIADVLYLLTRERREALRRATLDIGWTWD